MKTIEFTNSHRKKHFEFFRNMDQPHFNICSGVDITNLLTAIKNTQISFTSAVVYAIAHTANSIPQFRQRIRAEKVIEHDLVHPSFTVFTEISDVFSFCTVNYQEDFNSFRMHLKEMVNKMNTDPSFEDEEKRDDFLFLSAFPWVAFTSIMHPMHYTPVDSVPRFAWGKYTKENGKTKMPLSVQAHHALVDGKHMGQYFEGFQDLVSRPKQFLHA